MSNHLAAAVGSDLSCEAYRRTLYQPYAVHVKRNSASLITAIITQINITVLVLNSFLQFIASAVVAVALFAGFLLINAKVAVGAVGLLGTAYGALAAASKTKLRRNGQKIAERDVQQVKALQEGLGAIRDVLMDGQFTYLQLYQQADRQLRYYKAKNVCLAAFLGM